MRPIVIALFAACLAGPLHAQTAPRPDFISFGPGIVPRYNGFQGNDNAPLFHEPCRAGINAAVQSGSFVEGSIVQCGILAFGGGFNATAIGARSFAVENATALGNLAIAAGIGSTALGLGATADFDNSTAVGAGATTTAPDQVALGGPGSSVRIGDIDASTAAQDPGSVGVATVDASGTLGRDTTIIPFIRSLQTSSGAQAGQVTALQTAVAAQGTRITALESNQIMLSGRVDTLFDLRETDRRDLRQGIAAATAIGQAHFPSAPGRTSYNINVATFRGEQAIGGSLMHRLATEVPMAVALGFSHAGNRNTAAKVGIAGEF